MKPNVLVLTTVHSADDTRIRERLIRTLDARFFVTYATPSPGPTDADGLEVVILAGGRLGRNLRAFWTVFSMPWDCLILHDPETIPLGVLARFLKRRPVVFDVHEDLPAQIETKTWIRPMWRPIFRLIAKGLYKLADRFLTLSLAEANYGRLFNSDHMVFPNYPRSRAWPPPAVQSNGGAIYVGDVTRERGISDALEACAMADVPLTIVGPCAQEYCAELQRQAEALSAKIAVIGRVENPRAIELIRDSAVGLSPLRDSPNHQYSLPTKILEYLAMGIPVVATNLAGTRQIVERLSAVSLVEPRDTRGMSSAIRNALDEGIRLQASKQAALVREEYQWPESEVLAFYESMTRMVSGPPGD